MKKDYENQETNSFDDFQLGLTDGEEVSGLMQAVQQRQITLGIWLIHR